MNDILDQTAFSTEHAFATVETDEASGAIHGFELNGASAGPTIVVAGISPLLEAVFDRLSALPTLPWMRGKIIMRVMGHGDADVLIPEETVDDVLYLPGLVVPDLSEEAIKDGYLAILRLCTKLQMIQGRGVRL